MNIISKPIFIRKLHDKVGAEKCAAFVGCSSATIYAALREDKISLSYELASELVYNREFSEAGDNRCLIIHAPAHVCKTVTDLVDVLGGKHHQVP